MSTLVRPYTQLIIMIGASENVALSSDYRTKGVKAIEELVLTGGYRLAHVIKTIYGSSSIEEEFNFDIEIIESETEETAEAEVEQVAFLQ